MVQCNISCVVLAAGFVVSNSFSPIGLTTSDSNAQHHQGKNNQAITKYSHVSRCNRSARSRGHKTDAACSRFSTHLNAEKYSSSSEKNIFSQAFTLKLPWEARDDDGGTSPKTQLEKQEKHQQQQRTGKKSRRVARYPSSLETSIYSEKNVDRTTQTNVIDEYVQSAKGAVKSIRPGTSNNNSNKHTGSANPKKSLKLGILLIDHGSKRKASNDHLHAVAASYQSNLANHITHIKAVRVKVRAAHMEIASPSILAALRQLIAEDKATHVVCVPYFLSPGKHATIDVPRLINDARYILKNEGLLNLNSPESRENKTEKAEVLILASDALGSNVESMLDVVDGLVKTTLDDNGEVSEGLSGFIEANDRAARSSNPIRNTTTDRHSSQDNQKKVEAVEEQLIKYTNRAALLEKTLQSKMQMLMTMKNRSILLEDALVRLQNKMKQDKNRHKDDKELLAASSLQVANLTKSIKATHQEKDILEKTMAKSLVLQQIEYNKTITKLNLSQSALEQELHRQNSKEQLENKQQDKKYAALIREVELHEETIAQQKEQIRHLQTQLEYLLDDNVELEQLLENRTETIIQEYGKQLKESQKALKFEQEEKEKTRVGQMEVQRNLEEDKLRLQQTIDESSSKYEALLEVEKAGAVKWKEKYQLLNGTLSSTKNITTSETADSSTVANSTTKEEWSELQRELEEATLAKECAARQVQELELQLVEQQNTITQQQLKESTNSDKMKDKQQQQQQQEQLLMYLQAQLATYYETIETQKSNVSQLERQIKDMEQKQDESMLIATSSVEASKQREINLLRNVEELESDLAEVEKERDDGEKLLNDLQDRLARIEEDSNHASAATSFTSANQVDDSFDDKDSALTLPSLSSMAQQNKELTIQIEALELKLKSESQDKEQILRNKMKVETEIRQLPFIPRRLRDVILTTSSSSLNNNDVLLEDTNPKKRKHQGRKWVRVVLRPWTLLRKRKDSDQ